VLNADKVQIAHRNTKTMPTEAGGWCGDGRGGQEKEESSIYYFSL